MDICEETNEEEWAGRYEGWRLEDGSSRLCLPTIITRLLPACCSWKPFHFWLCIKCILCHTRANLQLLCVVNYQIIINNNIQTTATSLHVQKWCPQLNWSDSIFPSLNNRNTWKMHTHYVTSHVSFDQWTTDFVMILVLEIKNV